MIFKMVSDESFKPCQSQPDMLRNIFTNKKRREGYFISFFSQHMSCFLDDEDSAYLAEMNRIFGMGNGKDGRVGMWEVQRNTCWVQQSQSSDDVFLSHSGMLIHGTGGEVHILHLEGKDPQDAPHGWDHKHPIPPPFFVERTMGVVGISDSLSPGREEKSPLWTKTGSQHWQLDGSPKDDPGERECSFSDVGPSHHPCLVHISSNQPFFNIHTFIQ